MRESWLAVALLSSCSPILLAQHTTTVPSASSTPISSSSSSSSSSIHSSPPSSPPSIPSPSTASTSIATHHDSPASSTSAPSHSAPSIPSPSQASSSSATNRNLELDRRERSPRDMNASRKDNTLSHGQDTGIAGGGRAKGGSLPESSRMPDGGRQRELTDGAITKPKDDGLTVGAKRQTIESVSTHSDAASLKRLPCDKEPCAASPVKDGGIRRAICEAGPCVQCPPGSSPGRYGVCVASASHPPGAPSAVPPTSARYGTVAPAPIRRQVSGLQCETNCSLFTTQAASITTELRMLQSEERDACRHNPRSHACLSAQGRHQAKLLEYSMLLAQTPVSCQGLMPSYISFL